MGKTVVNKMSIEAHVALHNWLKERELTHSRAALVSIHEEFKKDTGISAPRAAIARHRKNLGWAPLHVFKTKELSSPQEAVSAQALIMVIDVMTEVLAAMMSGPTHSRTHIYQTMKETLQDLKTEIQEGKYVA